MLTGLKLDNSSTPQRGQKITTFDLLPSVMILHLLRFSYMDDTTKVSKMVSYPLDLTIPESYLSTNLKQSLLVKHGVGFGSNTGAGEKQPTRQEKEAVSEPFRQYELRAVCVHKGNKASSGHYLSFVKTCQQKWVEVDDFRVRPMTAKQVLDEPDAYMLFYHRKMPTN